MGLLSSHGNLLLLIASDLVAHSLEDVGARGRTHAHLRAHVRTHTHTRARVQTRTHLNEKAVTFLSFTCTRLTPEGKKKKKASYS